MSSYAVPNIEKPDKNNDGGDDACYKSCTDKMNRFLENLFAGIGYVVGKNPWKTIIVSLICCGLCFAGTILYEVENLGYKMWIPQESNAIKHKIWKDRESPISFRSVSVLLEKKDKSNILTSEAINHLHDIDLKVKEIYKENSERKLSALCIRTNEELCEPPMSVLEFWNYNSTMIKALTDDDVVKRFAEKDYISPITGRPVMVRRLIGEPIQQDNNFTITFGSVLKLVYRIERKPISKNSTGHLDDENVDAWEENFYNLMETYKIRGYTIYSTSYWGNNKAASEAINSDLKFFVIGYILVIFYLSVVLGSFSRLNQKVYLAIGGIVTIVLSIGVSYGVGSALRFKYTPMHNVLPFLLLGIGVDDIFVIVQCWDNIGASKINSGDVDKRTVAEKVSLTFKSAGISILVTSFTDICAFLIGSSTILPALRSFCIWCGIGILSVLLLTLTFFTALLALDAERQNKNRDACCCCIKISEDWNPMSCSQKSHLQGFVENYYAPWLLSVSGKIISMLVISGLLAGGVYGIAVELEQEFDLQWFYPSNSSARMYKKTDEVAFPNDGFSAAVYIGNIGYHNEYERMNEIVIKLNKNPFIVNGTAQSWYQSFYTWLKDNHRNSTLNCLRGPTSCRVRNESLFYNMLNVYLQDPRGKFFRSSIKFKDQTRTSIKASKFLFVHKKFEKTADEIEAMDSIKGEINPEKIMFKNSDGITPFVYTPSYLQWETNKIITQELAKNLGLAMICVFLVTMFLLSNVCASLSVVLSVALTLVDIAGYMAFWGLTIDTVTTIILIIAVGLTVDYNDHIAQAFMVSFGIDRNERMKNGLVAVAPAVINGGFSTFLAFALLVASTSYVFFTFFKVVSLVTIFGLLHGLVFLPIMLTIVGPKAQSLSGNKKDCKHSEHYKNSKRTDSKPTSHNKEIKSTPEPNRSNEIFVITKGGTINKTFAKDEENNSQ